MATKKNFYLALSAFAIMALLAFSAVLAREIPAAGQNQPRPPRDNATTTSDDKNRPNALKTLERIQDKSDAAIGKRIDSLNKLIERVERMKLLSATDKTALINQIDANIAGLNELKAEIQNGNTVTSTVDNAKKITKEYRVYALVIPKGYITASADRISSLAKKLETLEAKLSDKITQTKTSATSTAELQTELDKIDGAMKDMALKIADAKQKAQAAIDATANLTPDNGDSAVAVANKQALETARNNIKAATKDLNDARNSANEIAKILRHLGIKTNVGYGNIGSAATASTTITGN